MLSIGLTPFFAARQTRQLSVPTVTNLVPSPVDASQWSYLVATYRGPLGLDAVNGYPGHAIESAGAYFHRASYLQTDALLGDAFALTLLVRAGSSGRVRLWVRNLTSGVDRNISGSVDTFAGISGALEVQSNTLLADGLTRAVVATYTAESDGTLDFAIGPHSNVLGEDVVVIGAQVENGLVAHEFTA